MKKYLMTGIAALALCAGFTACSHDDFSFNEEDYVNSQKAQIDAKYQQAFVNAFGQPAKNHTWGFGNYTTRTADPRGNMWASEGWKVPPVITDAQKDIVRRYFQQNTPLGYNDPGWSDFWIQQVYKGGTKTTDGSQTTEKYRIGNGDEVVGGNHMDHLCSKSSNGTEDHVNDFNNSDNNDWEGRMLMVGSSTYTFGYINSNATAIHYDKAALVNWRVIAQWAVDKGLESSVEASVLNDGWNRSYMGFDWEQAFPEDCYAKGVSRPDENGNWQWYPNEYKTFEFDGQTYRFLIANSNQYAYDQTEPTYHGIKNITNDADLTDDLIRDLLSKGYLPYSDTKKDWIKLSTGADGYYSDWIVTLTKAEKNVPTTKKVRILCEDMNASTEKGDFDFNDAVFDLTLNGDNVETAYVTKIEILHTGAQFDIEVDGHEVHSVLGLNKGQFGSGYAAFDPSSATLTAKDVVVKTFRDFTYTKENGEKVIVKEELILQAPAGKAPAKILVETDCQIPEERVAIDTKYIKFTPWVADPEGTGPFWK